VNSSRDPNEKEGTNVEFFLYFLPKPNPIIQKEMEMLLFID
jgi:hypothetical protein